jgi:hypothetical protein
MNAASAIMFGSAAGSTAQKALRLEPTAGRRDAHI